MFRCSAACCEDGKASMQQVHQCIERCHAPLAQAQAVVTQELERFQVRQRDANKRGSGLLSLSLWKGHVSHIGCLSLSFRSRSARHDSCLSTPGASKASLQPSQQRGRFRNGPQRAVHRYFRLQNPPAFFPKEEGWGGGPEGRGGPHVALQMSLDGHPCPSLPL